MKKKEEQIESYWYIIPAPLAESGNSTKALLYGAISSLCNKSGYCWATNAFLAKKVGKLDQSIISSYITELEQEGWIKAKVSQNYKRKITVYKTTPFGKNRRGLGKNPMGVLEKSKESNIKSNIKSIITKNKEYKISYQLVEILKREYKIKKPDGNFEHDNIRPARSVAKSLKLEYVDYKKKGIEDKKIKEEIDKYTERQYQEKRFVEILTKMDDWNKGNATSMKYINNNWNKILNNLKK